MFRCDICKKVQEAGIAPTKTITQTREAIYPERWEEVDVELPDGRIKKERVLVDKGGTGWEIVAEINVCPKCLGENE